MRAKNLKYLRKKYKEKQVMLGSKINISQNALSDYENGKCPIPDDVAGKLAYHYRVSLFDFTNTDLSEHDLLDYKSGFLPVKRLAEQMLTALFPFVSPPTDCKDESFQKGYEMISTFQNRVTTLQAIETDEMAECLLLFSNAWKESKIESALANCLSVILWMCLGYYSEKNDQERTFIDSIMNQKTLDYIEAQKLILRGSPNIAKQHELTAGRLEYVRTYEEIAVDCIKCLKSSSDADLRALADYYLAVMYVVGFVDNEFDFETNQRIGFDLVGQLCRIDNPYAQALLSSIIENIGISDT